MFNRTFTRVLIGGAMLGVGLANATPVGRGAFCKYVKTAGAQTAALGNRDNQLAFVNRGGLANGGVCWWHSRFVRNAAYLAYFAPNARTPSVPEVRDILKKIRYGDEVVEIPGYSNLREFSEDWQSEIQNLLEGWQRVDGFFNQQWFSGLRGRSHQNADKMGRDMDKFYGIYTSARDVQFQRLQIPGITSHAWLLIGMAKVDDGYRLKVVDSNFPGAVKIYRYTRGDTNFDYFGDELYPYEMQASELKGLKRAGTDFCR